MSKCVSTIINFFVSTLGLVLFCGCQYPWRSEGLFEHSIVLIAVETLPQEALMCSDSSTDEVAGFQMLCKESVRFTHAFTPSTMSQAALASLMTGLWPYQHGVRHNGALFLPARFQTIAEMFLERHYRTSFFSGGPPIWHKSGLGQGFELFEDNIPVSRDQLHRPFYEVSQEFIGWLGRESTPFFSVLYVPDLQVFDLPTVDRGGHPTDRSFDGQLHQFDRSLGELIANLKKQNLWHDTYFILVGLNGRSRAERFNELPGSNLHVENTQVVLLVKPPQKIRDEAMTWKIDSNVSLVDLGKTLIDISGFSTPEDPIFKSTSLLKALTSPRETWDRERLIPIESGWAFWHKFGDIRYALRTSNTLYLMNKKVEMYNTLSDRLEASPQNADSKLNQILAITNGLPHLSSWVLGGNPAGLVDVGINLWDPSSAGGVVDAEFQKDKRILGWLALKAMKEKNWKDLFALSRISHDSEWEYLSSTMLGKKSMSAPRGDCFKLMEEKNNLIRADLYKSCDDVLAKLLSQVAFADAVGTDSTAVKEAFLKYYEQIALDRRITQLNMVNGMVWDVALDRFLSPTIGEILLYLPNQQKYLSLAEERLEQAKNL